MSNNSVNSDDIFIFYFWCLLFLCALFIEWPIFDCVKLNCVNILSDEMNISKLFIFKIFHYLKSNISLKRYNYLYHIIYQIFTILIPIMHLKWKEKKCALSLWINDTNFIHGIVNSISNSTYHCQTEQWYCGDFSLVQQVFNW